MTERRLGEAVTGPVAAHCSTVSCAAGEPLGATATTADEWLLVEVPGAWPRDVGDPGALPEGATAPVARWLEGSARRRLLFLRRPGRGSGALHVLVVTATEAAARVRRLVVDALPELESVDLEVAGDDVQTGLVLVCGHGSRDRCCAVHGTAVYGALAHTLGSDGLWISSHQGGHRFAANVLVLPGGIQLGRLTPGDAPEAVGRALSTEIDLEHYRGRTCYVPEAQAAELAVRTALGLDRLADLRLVGADGPVVRFRGRDGTEHAAVVERVQGPVVPVSCGASPEAQPTLVAQVLG